MLILGDSEGSVKAPFVFLFHYVSKALAGVSLSYDMGVHLVGFSVVPRISVKAMRCCEAVVVGSCSTLKPHYNKHGYNELSVITK